MDLTVELECNRRGVA